MIKRWTNLAWSRTMSEHDNDLRDKLISSLQLHGSRQNWSTLDEAVHEAALRLRVDRELINELHSILGTVPHESLVSRARVTAAQADRIRDLEAALRAVVEACRPFRGLGLPPAPLESLLRCLEAVLDGSEGQRKGEERARLER